MCLKLRRGKVNSHFCISYETYSSRSVNKILNTCCFCLLFFQVFKLHSFSSFLEFLCRPTVRKKTVCYIRFYSANIIGKNDTRSLNVEPWRKFQFYSQKYFIWKFHQTNCCYDTNHVPCTLLVLPPHRVHALFGWQKSRCFTPPTEKKWKIKVLI